MTFTKNRTIAVYAYTTGKKQDCLICKINVLFCKCNECKGDYQSKEFYTQFQFLSLKRIESKFKEYNDEETQVFDTKITSKQYYLSKSMT